jgi:uncharacterized protein YdcH (DUF465 family)
MANEPDNLVLVQLREIRATQAEIRATLSEHSAHFVRMNERFDQLDKRFEDFHALTSHTLLLGTTSSLKSQHIERRYEFSEGEQRRLGERMDEFERRLSKVEDKLGD